MYQIGPNLKHDRKGKETLVEDEVIDDLTMDNGEEGNEDEGEQEDLTILQDKEDNEDDGLDSLELSDDDFAN